MKLRRRIADAIRSPERLVSFGGRFAKIVVGGELAAIVARLHPRAFSPARYRAWIAARKRQIAVQATGTSESAVRLAVLVDPDDLTDTPHLVESLRLHSREGDVLFVRCADGAWREDNDLSTASQTRPSLSSVEQALKQMGGPATPWMLWVTAPLELDPHATSIIARVPSQFPGARLVYTDDDCIDRERRHSLPRFKPAWDTEQILEQNYVGPVLALHGSLAAEIDRERLRGSAGVWRLLIAASASQPPDAVVHVPHVLAHRHGGNAATSPMRVESGSSLIQNAVVSAARKRGTCVILANAGDMSVLRYRALPDDERASIVIPFRDKPDLLRRCVASIRENTSTPRHELVLVDNGSTDSDVARYCRELAATGNARHLPSPGDFNFAHLCNVGARSATGRVLVFLNNDTQIVDPGWLAELCSLATRPLTGAAGPLLTYVDGSIQSAGVLLGVNRLSTNALAGFAVTSEAAREWCSSRRRVTAVVGACLAIEREKFLAVGGMDEHLAISHNEVDLCLRLEERGLANVFTPFVRVTHIEGGTRGYDVLPAERRQLDEDERCFLQRWSDTVATTDPAHNPNLRRDGSALALDFGAVLPRPRAGWRDQRST